LKLWSLNSPDPVKNASEWLRSFRRVLFQPQIKTCGVRVNDDLEKVASSGNKAVPRVSPLPRKRLLVSKSNDEVDDDSNRSVNSHPAPHGAGADGVQQVSELAVLHPSWILEHSLARVGATPVCVLDVPRLHQVAPSVTSLKGPRLRLSSPRFPARSDGWRASSQCEARQVRFLDTP
jgi:hypothetical protein